MIRPALILLVRSAVGALTALLLTPLAHAQSTLLVVYDLRPPIVTREGDQLAGSVGALAEQVLQRSRLAYVLQEVPVRRQLSMVEANAQPVCALGRIKTAERLKQGWFSQAFGQARGYVALVRRQDSLPEPASLSLWARQSALRWGVQAGLHYSDQISQIREYAQASVTSFNANHQHFAELLLAQRIDFVVLQADEADAMLRNHPPYASRLRSVVLGDLQGAEQRFFYCSKKVTEAQRQALNQAIASLNKPPAASSRRSKP